MGSRRSVVRSGIVVAVVGMGSVACAGSGEDAAERSSTVETTVAASAAVPTTTGAATAGATVASALPKVDVVDLASGATVRLSELPTDGKPMLLWMWAPY